MNSEDRKPFAGVTAEALQAELAASGRKGFVARQVMAAVYGRNVRSFDEISNVPLDVRHELAARYALRTLEVAGKFESPDGSFKLLLRLGDGNLIECAYLAEGDRGTACVSSQVGCAMGCAFCASGDTGLVRDLEWFEMVEQVLAVRDHVAEGRRLSHVTFMGIGEPLANFENLSRALEVINSPEGLNIGARRISISTCGFAEGIRRLAALGKQFHLAVSLHAPNDELRQRLMPTAGKVPLADILRASERYVEQTTRKVTFEYVLIRDVNDSVEHARQLAALVGRFPSMVNVIPFNAVTSRPEFRPPLRKQVERFVSALKKAGAEACVRRRKGAEVDAACGQLRARLVGEERGR